MSGFPRNQQVFFKLKKNAGGTDHVPPAPCPPAAHLSAYAAAYVEGTGRDRSSAHARIGSGMGLRKSGLVQPVEAGVCF
jgi:hypothetical protein